MKETTRKTQATTEKSERVEMSFKAEEDGEITRISTKQRKAVATSFLDPW